MIAYPKIRYHLTLAPEGKLVKTPEDEPKGEGWVDTPAAFDPDYVAPPPLDPNAVVSDAVRPGYIPQPFPAIRYDSLGNMQLVKTQEEADALDPRQWKASPQDFKETPDPAVETGVPAAPRVPPTPLDELALVPPTPPTDAEIEAQKNELFAATVPVIAEKIATISDISTLATIRAYEETNPKGARTGVIKAVDARLAELTKR